MKAGNNMATFTKHVGKLTASNQNAKVLVVFRQLPEEPSQALVVLTQQLDANMHDQLMAIVENQGQNDMDFYKIASRETFFDGRNLLESLHLRGLLVKMPTSDITMTPSSGMEIALDQLNKQLNEMAPVKTTSGDISGDYNTPAPAASTSTPGTLDDKTIAEGMRRQAMQFEAEVKRLREEADKLDPNRQGRPRKSAKSETSVEA
jgi:hypothetical protein